ncbi:hypothetical protein [Streptomyces sp. NPDC007172]|uniref:hypothetical protein n=1 Tax=Streptomyces sp. NPDC007172 TaxID=3364776 RepID=UPI0036C661A9
MDQCTREHLLVLPALVSTANRLRPAAAELLRTAQATVPGTAIPGTEGSLRRAVTSKAAGRFTWAEESSTGRRRSLPFEEEEAFWAFVAVEVLRLTGIRKEELLELTHHSITDRTPANDATVHDLLAAGLSRRAIGANSA